MGWKLPVRDFIKDVGFKILDYGHKVRLGLAPQAGARCERVLLSYSVLSVAWSVARAGAGR